MKYGIEQAVADINAKGGILGRKVRADLLRHPEQA